MLTTQIVAKSCSICAANMNIVEREPIARPCETT